MADISLTANSSQQPTSSGKPARSPEFIANVLMAGVVILLIGILLIVVNAVHNLPNAYIGIKSQGLNPYEYSDLKRLLGDRAHGNFLQADLDSYVEKLQGVSWVGQVDIRRDWHQGLLVNVVPRQPVAKFGSERLVDANGVVFKPADPSQLNAQYWMQLQGDDKDAVVMMQQVKQVGDWYQPLGLKVEEVIVTPRMAWLFRFDNGLRVLVDNEDTSEKLYRLSVMLQNQLHPKLAKIQTVDLRYKNGMAITWRNAISSKELEKATVAKSSKISNDGKSSTQSAISSATEVTVDNGMALATKPAITSKPKLARAETGSLDAGLPNHSAQSQQSATTTHTMPAISNERVHAKPTTQVAIQKP